MDKMHVKYFVVDAFTNTAFKGNPAAVCLLEESRDDEWLQAVATEFNISETCYLSRVDDNASSVPRFNLRWFTPVAEVDLCGHATLAASHTLFANGLVDSSKIEYVTRSGILTAKKVPDVKSNDLSSNQNGETKDNYLIELDFPTISTTEFNSNEVALIAEAVNGKPIIEITMTTPSGDLFVVLPSSDAVTAIKPNSDVIKKCPGKSGLIVSAMAPPDSGFDFYSRYFCPKYGINEDPVCGSAHCALATYWSKRLGKCDFVAYVASPRGGVVKIHLDEENQRVLLKRKSCHCYGRHRFSLAKDFYSRSIH